MKSTDNIGLFTALIGSSAASGNIATVPDTQGNPGDGTASIALGFPPETFIDRAAGGVPPRGQDMNGFLNRMSRAIQVLQAGYFGKFNGSLAAAIGGYPAGAIVQGSGVGTFWVSTTDNNTSTPGASDATWRNLFSGYLPLSGGTLTGLLTVTAVTDWTKRQAVGALDAEGRYVASYGGVTGSLRVDRLIIDGGTGNPTAHDVNGNWHPIQPAGDYAMNAALSNEATTRANADASLNNAKVNRSGDNLSGNLFSSASFLAGYGGGWRGGTASGSRRWTSGGLWFGNPDNLSSVAYTGTWQVSDILDNGASDQSGLNAVGYDAQGKQYNWWLSWNGNVVTPKGNVAFESEINNLQSQVNGKQPAGNYQQAGSYVTTDTYASDFGTSDDRIINIAYNSRIETFEITGINSGNNYAAFPQGFASIPKVTPGISSNSYSVIWVYNVTKDGFNYNINSSGPQGISATFIVIGKKS